MSYTYPYRGNTLSLKQAKRVIVDVVYQGDDRGKALNRVGTRINHAIEKCILYSK